MSTNEQALRNRKRPSQDTQRLDIRQILPITCTEVNVALFCILTYNVYQVKAVVKNPCLYSSVI